MLSSLYTSRYKIGRNMGRKPPNTLLFSHKTNNRVCAPTSPNWFRKTLDGRAGSMAAVLVMSHLEAEQKTRTAMPYGFLSGNAMTTIGHKPNTTFQSTSKRKPKARRSKRNQGASSSKMELAFQEAHCNSGLPECAQEYCGHVDLFITLAGALRRKCRNDLPKTAN